MEQARDLARRREFGRAREKFVDSATKFSKEGGLHFANLATAYAELMTLRGSNNDPARLASLANLLRTTLSSSELRPGPRGIRGDQLAHQLDLEARDSALIGALRTGHPDPNLVGEGLRALATDYQALGDEILFLPEMFDQRTVAASSRAPVLMALSFELLGEATKDSDPMAAAEHYQSAQQYWSLAGDPVRSGAAAEQINRLSLQAKCWFCGREGAGHGVQFVSLPIDRDVSGLRSHESSGFPSVDRAGRHVYACKGCDAALRVLSDRMAVARTAEMAEVLRAEMRALEQRISSRVYATARR